VEELKLQGEPEKMVIDGRCPKCNHPQKHTFDFKKDGPTIEFTCSNCGFENAITRTALPDNGEKCDNGGCRYS
jgi:transcription elongation factor Elf1